MNEETLFEQALSRSPEDRAAFLDEACAGRPELRAAVEALLAAHEKSGNILDRPPIDPAQSEATRPGQPRPDATLDHTPEPDDPSPDLTRTTDLEPDSQSGLVIAGRYALPAEDRRGRHGRGLGRQADRAGQAQGGAQADQDRHGLEGRGRSASSRSGRPWR